MCIFRRLAGIPDFISGDDMDKMISDGRLDSKVVFAYVQEVYRALKDNENEVGLFYVVYFFMYQ